MKKVSVLISLVISYVLTSCTVHVYETDTPTKVVVADGDPVKKGRESRRAKRGEKNEDTPAEQVAEAEAAPEVAAEPAPEPSKASCNVKDTPLKSDRKEFSKDNDLNGMVFLIKKQQPVYASVDGEVIHVGDLPNLKNGVVIRTKDNKDRVVAYGFLEKIRVRKGQQVNACDQIAVSGKIPRYKSDGILMQIKEKDKILENGY